MRNRFFPASRLLSSPSSGTDSTPHQSRNRAAVSRRRRLLCETLERRLLLTANSLQDLFSADSNAGELGVQRSIVPGELVVGYQNGSDQKDGFDGVAMLTTHLKQSLNQERESQGEILGEILGESLLQIDASSDQPLDLFHFQFDTGTDLLELATRTLALPGVAWVAPNYHYSGDLKDFLPNDPLANNQYHHALIGSETAWDVTLGDPSVVIAVTDDGVQLDHPDLAANIWQNTAELGGIAGVDDDNNGFVDDFNGWDFVTGDNDPSPINSGDDHGTHVAGIAAGITNNNNQIAGVSGGSSIMPIRIAGGGGFTSTIMAGAFTYAIDNGARIANTSYNINRFVGDPTFTAGLQYYHDNGGIHFNSAGNSNELNPARQAFEQTILVASTTVVDTKSSFSNYGTGIDVAAPGSSILSTVTLGGTGTKSGTSMAAPNAAGAAALIWSANPTWTRDQVIAYLLETADNIDAANPSYVGLLGSGRINIGDLGAVLAPPQVAEQTGLPSDGASVSMNTTIDQFTLRFDQLMDLSGMNSSANFILSEAGPNGIAGDSDDVAVPITADSTYMIGSNDFSFTIDGGSLGIGKYVLTINPTLTNPFGTALDGDGNGTAGDAYQTFFDIVAPPLEPVAPLGSLIFDLPIDGVIGTSGETDTFTIDLEAGQRLTLIAEPDSSLTPTIDVIGPGGSIGSGSSLGAGQDLVLQSLVITTPGTYSVEISGNSGTVGSYLLELILNADAELESYGGATNDTLATAQDINASIVDLGFGIADRLAVVGQLPSASGSDWYRFTTSSGGSNTLALTQLGSGSAALELYDSGGNLIASGVPSDNADQVISQYLTAGSSTHYARVVGTDTPYSLLVTGDSDFDREVNDNGVAQDLSPLPNATVLGAVLNAITDDEFTVDVNSGDELIISTLTPGGGPLQPTNLLDPGIELFDPSGSPISHTNVLGNESLSHTASATGKYKIRVFSEGNSGAYVLNIAGRTASQSSFDVIATDPFAGQRLTITPSEVVVDFSSALLLTSVDAADLSIDGNPAASVTVVDGDTLRFQIGAVSEGTHTIQIAAGALTSLQGTVIEPFSSQFDLDIVAPPLQIIDNGDSGYSTVGSNWFPGSGFGFDGDFDVHPAGTGTDMAQWTFSGLTPGLYRVSATWLDNPELATNAPFTILDGGAPLTTVNVNQQLAPADFTFQDTSWQYLGGVQQITGDSLVVQLGDGADHAVLADAIHIEQIPGDIIDNGDSGYSTVGPDWLTSASGFGYDGDIDLHSPGSGAELARWTFSGLTPGNYRVSASWFPIPSLATDAPFTVFDGTTPLSTVTVDQQLEPSTSREGGVLWEQLGGPYSITGSELVVELSNLADGIVLADAIHIERLGGTVIDDGESGYSTIGGWIPLAVGLGYGFDGDFDVGEPGTGADIAAWTFTGLTPGQFRVSATWLPLSGLATDAPFTVLDGGNPFSTVNIDLTEQPNHFASGGAYWQDLGDPYPITGSTLVVQLSDEANALLLADAVRIERVGELPGLPLSAMSNLATSVLQPMEAVVDTRATHDLLRSTPIADRRDRLTDRAPENRQHRLVATVPEPIGAEPIVPEPIGAEPIGPGPIGPQETLKQITTKRHRVERVDNDSISASLAESADQFFGLLDQQDDILRTF